MERYFSPKYFDAEHKYKVDLEKGDVSWIDQEKVITVNYRSKIIKLWNKKKVSYLESRKLFSLLHAYKEEYFEEKRGNKSVMQIEFAKRDSLQHRKSYHLQVRLSI